MWVLQQSVKNVDNNNKDEIVDGFSTKLNDQTNLSALMRLENIFVVTSSPEIITVGCALIKTLEL